MGIINGVLVSASFLGLIYLFYGMVFGFRYCCNNPLKIFKSIISNKEFDEILNKIFTESNLMFFKDLTYNHFKIDIFHIVYYPDDYDLK